MNQNDIDEYIITILIKQFALNIKFLAHKSFRAK